MPGVRRDANAGVRRNLETKARCADLLDVASRARAIGALRIGNLHQRDAYAVVEEGRRLKLREWRQTLPSGTAETGAELIDYRRADLSGSRLSTFTVTPLPDPVSALEILARDHGIHGEVVKRRELWLAATSRIHLDRVAGLGDFVEVETIVTDEYAKAEEEHHRVCAALGIDGARTIAGSYIDLLEQQTEERAR